MVLTVKNKMRIEKFSGQENIIRNFWRAFFSKQREEQDSKRGLEFFALTMNKTL